MTSISFNKTSPVSTEERIKPAIYFSTRTITLATATLATALTIAGLGYLYFSNQPNQTAKPMLEYEPHLPQFGPELAPKKDGALSIITVNTDPIFAFKPFTEVQLSQFALPPSFMENITTIFTAPTNALALITTSELPRNLSTKKKTTFGPELPPPVLQVLLPKIEPNSAQIHGQLSTQPAGSDRRLAEMLQSRAHTARLNHRITL